MNSEEFMLSRVDLDGEGEELAEAELREMLAAIDCKSCPACGKDKAVYHIFCVPCVEALPLETRTKLYRVRAYGDVDTYDEAKALLRLHAQIQEAKIERLRARYSQEAKR